MDLYHIWCDLKPGVDDLEFVAAVEAYLGHLRDAGRLEGWRLTRRKLGLAPPELGEFHLWIETRDLAQLDGAFRAAAARAGAVEGLHQAVNSKVTGLRFALYRDFPDPGRERGAEGT